MTYQAASALVPVLAVCWSVWLSLVAGRAVWRIGSAWYWVAASSAVAAAGSVFAVPVIQGGLLTAATGPEAAAAAFFVPASAVLVALTVTFMLSVSAGYLSLYQFLRRTSSGIALALSGMVAARVVAGAWQATTADGRWNMAMLLWIITVAVVVVTRPRPIRGRQSVTAAGAGRLPRAVQRPHQELVETARHEAAHAVVARALRLDVARVDVVATHAYLGVTTVTPPTASADALYDLMTVFLAADVAVVAGRGPELGAEDDVSRAAAAALTIIARAGTPSSLPPDTALTLEQLMGCARARAADLLARHHRATAGLIERLLRDPARPVTRTELEDLVPVLEQVAAS